MSLPLQSSGKPLGENSTTGLREKPDVVFDRHLSAEVSKSLYYQDINNRRNHIYEDKSESYSWIWCSTDSSSCFTKWLSDGRGVFWITGRPGSGKSTLVKYLMNHSKTKQYLTLSRHDQDWRIVSFFFDFRAAKGFANNFEGLLRSLLLPITHEEPEILAIIQSHGIEDFDPELRLKWSVPTLRSALQTALTKSTSNICIFVDGLDEYEGSYRDLVDLFKDVESLLGRNERPRVKVCLASWPEPVLLVLLNESTGFRMQDCNASSISLCVSRRLEPILKTEADSEVNRLGERISEMAEGIFLWAILAIDDVIEQWAYGTAFLEIETGLQSLPTDLDAMYARILGRIKGKHRQEGSLMLYLVCYAAHTITVEQLYTAVSISMAESDVSIERPRVELISSFARRGILGEFRSMSRSVNSEQTRPDNSIRNRDVKPLHETVRTFLERSTTARSFFMDETTCQYRATELWLRVCSRYFEISGTVFRTRGITPDLEWIRDSSYKFPLNQYMRKNLGYHAHMFENDSEQSSYSLLDPILTKQNIDLFDLDNQLDEGTSSLTPLSFAAGHGLALFCRDKIVAGADVNEYDGRALLKATANAHERTVRMLLEHGALLTKMHLVKILQNLSLQIIKEIWSSQGANQQSEDREPFKVLSPLHSVVLSNAVNFDDLIVFFSRSGEDVNVCAGPHGTPLHTLLCKPPRMLVAKKMRVLIQNGANVNADGPEGKPLDLVLEKSKTVDHLYLVETIRRIELLIVNGAISDHTDEDVIHRMRVLVNKFDKLRNNDEAQNLKQRAMDYIDKLLSRKPAEFAEEGL